MAKRSSPQKIQLKSIQETHALAARIARKISLPCVILLEGELGAGKTEWVRGFVKAYLGEVELVMSPTYTLINAYEHGDKRVYHVDLYRLVGEDDLESIGFWDLFSESQSVVVVEWAEKITSKFPKSHFVVKIKLEHDRGETERKASVQPAFF